MKKSQLFIIAFAALFGFVVACATRAGSPVTTAQLPPVAGQMTECVAVNTWVGRGRALNAGQFPEAVRVPPGWTPIGGGGDGVIIFCH